MNERARHVVLATALAAVAVCTLGAQAAPASKPSFEVATIKRNPSTSPARGAFGVRGSRFVMTNVTLVLMMQWAYRTSDAKLLLPSQITGGPGWAKSARFDLEAKPYEDARSISTAHMRELVQALIENRFQLKVRHETRQMPAYELVVAKGGPKIRLSKDQTPPVSTARGERAADDGTRRRDSSDVAHGQIRVRFNSSSATLAGNAVTIDALTNLLQGFVGRPIVDKTNLEGLFDMQVKVDMALTAGGFGAVSASGQDGDDPVARAGSMFHALEEQLGLRLVSTKGPVEVIVIDSVQPPVEN